MDNQKNFESEELQCSECGTTVNFNDLKCPNCGADFEENTDNLNEKIKEGRTLAILIIISTLVVSVSVNIANIIRFDAGKLLIGMIHLGLTIELLSLFYRGVNGARLIMIVLFALAGLLSLFLGILMINLSWFGVLIILLGFFYFSILVLLSRVKSIRLFQEYQREISITINREDGYA